jgi:NADPH:quinone reductase
LTQIPTDTRQLVSTITNAGTLTLRLNRNPIPSPAPDEVVVKVEAAPINPSDLGLMFGATDWSKAMGSGSGYEAVITVPVPDHLMRHVQSRLGKAMLPGNEGAGTVVGAGDSPAAQAMLGRKVGMMGGAMYADYRVVKLMNCLPLPDDVSTKEGASCFVNPLTALSFVETLREEGHTAMVNTAGASNLGQMLVKLCAAEGIKLISIVRKAEQEAILARVGAKHILNSGVADFLPALTAKLIETDATLAFDAIGGGKMAGQILSCMEQAQATKMTEYSVYGSTRHKQVYIYGILNSAPTELPRNTGFAWDVGGWLLTPRLQKAGMAKVVAMRDRVAANLKTIFASDYSHEITLADVVNVDVMMNYAAKRTGEKYVIMG